MNKYMVLFTVCVGTVLSTYVSSCVNIALPNIMAALNYDADSIVWVSLSYLIPYGSILPLTGKLGDEYGPKKVYLIGLSLFTVASFGCGMANSSQMMIVIRIFQGIGAGLLLPNSMTLVAQSFGSHERGQALGIWGAMAAAGGAMGPTIGGYLIDLFAWRAIFFSIVPFCIFALLLSVVTLPNLPPRRSGKIDYLGGALLIGAISAILIALNKGEKEGWTSLYIVSLFYGSFASFILFLAWELKVENPMIDLYLFKSVNFSLANILGFASFMVFYGTMYLLPFFMKSLLNYSSVQAGVMMLPLTATMVLIAPLGGKLSDRIGSRYPALIGMILITLALFMFRTIDLQYGSHQFFVRLTLFGLGLGFTMAPLSNCAINSLPPSKIGVGSGFFNLAKMVGGSVGMVFAQTLLTQRGIYHSAVFKESLADNAGAGDIFLHMQSLWGSVGMSRDQIANAMLAWQSGQGLSNIQFDTLKAALLKIIQLKSSVLSFQDVFFALAMLCLVGTLLALGIQKKAKNPST